MEGKAPVAMAGFSLGAGQGVFFLGVGVQEYREILAHGAEPVGFHFFRRGANHDPVLFRHGEAEQGVPHRTAHQIHFHLVYL